MPVVDAHIHTSAKLARPLSPPIPDYFVQKVITFSLFCHSSSLGVAVRRQALCGRLARAGRRIFPLCIPESDRLDVYILPFVTFSPQFLFATLFIWPVEPRCQSNSHLLRGAARRVLRFFAAIQYVICFHLSVFFCRNLPLIAMPIPL